VLFCLSRWFSCFRAVAALVVCIGRPIESLI
jgi:hypothetical protein